MAKKIEYLRIEPADNGLIISYDERNESSSSGEKSTYDMPSYVSRKEVFDFDDPSEKNEGFEEAMARFKELFAMWQSQQSKK